MSRIIKNYVAAVALTHRAQVKFTANDGEVTLATAATDPIAGVVDFPGGVAAGERVDVVLFGETEVVAGGAGAPGAFITAGAAGVSVAAAPAAGVNAYVAGRILAGMANGDFVRAFINPGRIQG